MNGVSYQLSEDQQRVLLDALLGEFRQSLPGGPLACFRLAGTSPYANLARRLESEVFLADLGDDWRALAQDFDGLEANSHFFLLVDLQLRKPVGSLRFVDGSRADFDCFRHLRARSASFDPDHVFASCGTDAAHTWELGAVVVLPEYRAAATASIAAGVLYRCLYAAAVASGIDIVVALIWPDMLAKFHHLGMPVAPLLDEQPIHFPNGMTYYPTVTLIDGFAQHMRDYGRRLLEHAADESDRSYARHKNLQIEAILTGAGLDDLLTFRHEPIVASDTQG